MAWVVDSSCYLQVTALIKPYPVSTSTLANVEDQALTFHITILGDLKRPYLITTVPTRAANNDVADPSIMHDRRSIRALNLRLRQYACDGTVSIDLIDCLGIHLQR